MASVDILAIDQYIKDRFKQDRNTLPDKREKLNDLYSILNTTNLSQATIESINDNILTLENEITQIESNDAFNFYILETQSHIEQYKNILNTPVKISFFKKINTQSFEKDKIISEYINIARKYYNISEFLTDNPDIIFTEKPLVCQICNNSVFDIEDDTSICVNCGVQYENITQSLSFKDNTRINISSKYSYDRLIHFKDSINQYQAKQNSFIPQKVYSELYDQFERHHLVSQDAVNKYAKVTKEQIGMFLKILGYTKHYENINLIHYKITGIPPDDISHLENKLMDDFITLTSLYDKRYKLEKRITRKNFINTHYVLFQLLNRHKHPCKKDDFNLLKTIDRQNFHDDISKELFGELGWNIVLLN